MQVGRRTLGGFSAALGAIGIAWGAFAFAWQPIPPDFPGYTALAYVLGLVLLLGGIGLCTERAMRISAYGLAVVYACFAIPWAVRIVRFPQLFGVWGGFAEQLSIILALLILMDARGDRERSTAILIKTYGVCAIVFGFNHFLSLQQTADMVPAWLPPGQRFWAVATGVFHCAAGVAILAGFRAALAARALAAMMLVFEVLVWLPLLVKSPGVHMMWAGNAVDVALAGAALVIADALQRRSVASVSDAWTSDNGSQPLGA